MLALAGSAAGCGGDSEAAAEQTRSVKVNMTLERYNNAAGATTAPVWSAGEKGGLFISGTGVSQPNFGLPLTTGSSKSLFLFPVTTAAETATIVGFYPADAALTCENGQLKTRIPAAQDGKENVCLAGWTTGRLDSYGGLDLSLRQLFATMYVSAAKGSYRIAKVTVEANGGEAIAGDLTIDIADGKATATEKRVTLDFSAAPVDCSAASQRWAVLLAPVTLAQGYTVTLTDTEGNDITLTTSEQIDLTMNGRIDTDSAESSAVTKLVFCGSNMVYIIDAGLATSTGYKDAVLWSWDATTAAQTLGLAANRCNHLDDCKPVDNGKKLLLTSSYHWTVLIDIATQELLFWTSQSSNAHSAEILPGNRIAVACSDGTTATHNQIQIYDIAQPNKVLYQTTLDSAHGVVWNPQTERLYAIGGKSLNIYKLKNWESSSPSLELERGETTPQNGLHDLTLVNPSTLCVAGKRAYLYDTGTRTFTEMKLFSSSTSLKSVNYNDETNEVWWTDATVPEGTQTWSSQTIRYSTDPNGREERTIKVPDLDMYKVRVLSW